MSRSRSGQQFDLRRAIAETRWGAEPVEIPLEMLKTRAARWTSGCSRVSVGIFELRMGF